MANDKLKSLQKYQNKLKELLSSSPPEKHKNRPEEYKFFLQKDLDITTKKIEYLILSGSGNKL